MKTESFAIIAVAFVMGGAIGYTAANSGVIEQKNISTSVVSMKEMMKI